MGINNLMVVLIGILMLLHTIQAESAKKENIEISSNTYNNSTKPKETTTHANDSKSLINDSTFWHGCINSLIMIFALEFGDRVFLSYKHVDFYDDRNFLDEAWKNESNASSYYCYGWMPSYICCLWNNFPFTFLSKLYCVLLPCSILVLWLLAFI